MPPVRKRGDGIGEARSDPPEGIARTLFTVGGDCLVLLHGFSQKSQRLPGKELQIARNRRRLLLKSSRE
jgi:phage-related protein